MIFNAIVVFSLIFFFDKRSFDSSTSTSFFLVDYHTPATAPIVTH